MPREGLQSLSPEVAMTLQDVASAARSLGRSPGLAGIAILTTALGVAAATALFSVVKAVLLNPLPYPDPDRIVWVASTNQGQDIRTSMPDFDDWRRQARSFASLALYSEAPVIASGGETPLHVSATIVSEDFFDVLGVRPALGRAFLAEDHRPGAPLAAVVLSHGLWQRAYAGDPAIVGRQIRLLGIPSTVVGVMPEGFAFPASSDLWVSARALPDGNVRTAHNYWVVGRLAPTVTASLAHDEIGAVARELKRQYPGPYQTEDARVEPLASHLVGRARAPLLVLLGAVGLLVLIVCVNVANLLLVHAAARARELAVRTALGASRSQLFRQLFVESLLLALAGGAGGLLLAFWSMDLIRVLLPATLPRAGDVRLDTGVVLFATAVAAGAAVLFGTLPAWRASRPDVNDILRAASRGLTATKRSRRMQGALVVSEVALSLILLAGAGVLAESYLRLRSVDAGFSPDGVLTASLSFPMNPKEVARLADRYRDLLARVRALPGVEAAGTIKDLPLNPIQRGGNFFIEGRSRDMALDAGYLVVTPGMMEALRIPILRGRGFSESDSAASQAVVVINAEMARRFWPDRDPLGERIWFNSFEPKERWLTVVGVAGDVRQRGLTEPVPPLAYVTYTQPQIAAQLGSAVLVVRSGVSPDTLIPAVRSALREVHPEAAASFRTMADVMAEATSRQRFQMQVLGAFAILSLVLAIVGLYGVISFAVTSARAAIGVRIALGAQPRRIFRMVIGEAIALTGVGAAIGLAGSLAVGGVLGPVIVDVAPADPRVLTLAVAAMLVAAAAAAWLPARRAMRVDPVAALRDD
jgi:predicted permease